MEKLSLKILIFVLILGTPTIAQETNSDQPVPDPQLLMDEIIDTEMLEDGSLLVSFSIDFVGELEIIDTFLGLITQDPVLHEVSYAISFFYINREDLAKFIKVDPNETNFKGLVTLGNNNRLDGPVNIEFKIEGFCDFLTDTFLTRRDKVVLTIDTMAIGSEVTSDGLFRDFATASKNLNVQSCPGFGLGGQ